MAQPNQLEEADVETSSAGYAQRFAGPVGAWFLELQAQATRELLGAGPARVLDLGGGHGQLTGTLVEAGHQVTVYGSAQVCEQRIQTWVQTGQAQFVYGDLLHAPWPDQSFDVVLCFRLLPHVRRVTELVAELCRLARRVVIVDYPTRRSLNAVSGALFGLKKRVEGNTRPFTVFSDPEMVGHFASRGFRVTERRPQFFFPMALHRAMGLLPVSRGLEAVPHAFGITRALGSPVILRLERG